MGPSMDRLHGGRDCWWLWKGGHLGQRAWQNLWLAPLWNGKPMWDGESEGWLSEGWWPSVEGGWRCLP